MDNSTEYDCKSVGQLTDIFALATQMGIALNTQKGVPKAKRTLCTEINKRQDEYNWTITGRAESAEPLYDSDRKQTMIDVNFQYFADEYAMPAIDVLFLDHTEGESFQKDGKEMIKVYWQGVDQPTDEPVENIKRKFDGKYKIERKKAPIQNEHDADAAPKKVVAEVAEKKIVEPTVPLVDGDDKDLPSVPPSLAKLNTLSEYFKKDLKSYYKFRGKYANTWGWLMYLQNLLGKDVICVTAGQFSFIPSHEFFIKKYGKNSSIAPDPVIYPKMLRVIRFEPSGQEIDNSIKQCFKEGARFSVAMLTIKTSAATSHANALIFDNKYKRITRFEPHGAKTSRYDSDDLDEQIRTWRQKNKKGWVYNAPTMFCPAKGPQNLESRVILKESTAFRGAKSEAGGFCAVWSLLFIHLRVVNPQATDEEIVKSLTMQTAQELALKVRKYTEFITDAINLK